MTNRILALTVAGIVFSIVALAHLSRLIWQFELTIAGQAIPLWTNALGFAVSLSLAIWMFMSSKP